MWNLPLQIIAVMDRGCLRPLVNGNVPKIEQDWAFGLFLPDAWPFRFRRRGRLRSKERASEDLIGIVKADTADVNLSFLDYVQSFSP